MPAGSVKDQNALASVESLRALDWLNAFVAALMMGFGPFVAGALAERGWTPANVGLVLTATGLAGLSLQAPVGELMDRVQSKRALVAAGTAALVVAALIFGLRSDFPSIFTAAVMQGAGASIVGP
ncbi:MAG: MFS transporter, partial [Caulobacteraceae bacterium]|nr:MFS transporter [Caulobacteraceae bacterium]